MVKCSVYQCSNRSAMKKQSQLDEEAARGRKFSFHAFPLDEDLFKQWVKATRRADWIPGHTDVMCSAHFEDKCYEYLTLDPSWKRRLRKDAVPTLLPGHHSLKMPSPKRGRPPGRRASTPPKTVHLVTPSWYVPQNDFTPPKPILPVTRSNAPATIEKSNLQRSSKRSLSSNKNSLASTFANLVGKKLQFNLPSLEKSSPDQNFDGHSSLNSLSESHQSLIDHSYFQPMPSSKSNQNLKEKESGIPSYPSSEPNQNFIVLVGGLHFLSEPLPESDRNLKEGSDFHSEPVSESNQNPKEHSDFHSEPSSEFDQNTKEPTDFHLEPSSESDQNLERELPESDFNPDDIVDPVDMDTSVENIETSETMISLPEEDSQPTDLFETVTVKNPTKGFVATSLLEVSQSGVWQSCSHCRLFNQANKLLANTLEGKEKAICFLKAEVMQLRKQLESSNRKVSSLEEKLNYDQVLKGKKFKRK